MLSLGCCAPYRRAMAAEQPPYLGLTSLPDGLGGARGFADAVAPAAFPQAVLRWRNQRWADAIGLGDLDAVAFEAHFARFEALPANLPQPLALRYHGHQFRHYNPDLGDGRGFLFAQCRAADGRWLDLGTKGSGQTPWSRRGDGRLTLKGGMREILATEMLEALGVNTSKSFALFETGEALWRGDEPSPTRSAVLTRLSHGHIRIGSFQRFAFTRDVDRIAQLSDYGLATLYDETPAGDSAARAERLFDLVASATARTTAGWLAAGFVHGVLNSDNIAISGESFDYGPWRFTPYWDEDFTAAYFDEGGLYAFGRQPESVHWNLAQLGGCLALIGAEAALAAILNDWPARFTAALGAALLGRLGVAPADPGNDRALVAALLQALRSQRVTIDQLFFDWRGGRRPDWALYRDPIFAPLAAALAGRDRPLTHPYWQSPHPVALPIERVEAIWADIEGNDDWSAFDRGISAIRAMGDAMQQDAA